MNAAKDSMYKTDMKPALSVHESYHHIALEGAPQITDCNRCVLLEWEHDDFSAPFWRWYCNDRDGASLLLPNRRIEIGAGEVVLVPPHTVAGTSLEGKVGHLFIHFTLGLDRAATPGEVFKRKAGARERALIRRLEGLAEGDGPDRRLGATFLAQALVNLAMAEIPADYWAGRLTDARIARAMQALAADEVVADNAGLARAAGMHPDAFVRKFVQATGHTPHRFGLRLRVERAAARLREGRLSIDEIAAAAGFCDRFHFSRVFKQVMGTSPARYRRSNAAAGGRG